MRSEPFDDIYFSTEDGLAESRHTYLAGNQLPEAWHGKEAFGILELGFGSGLNFLATLAAWRRTAASEQELHYCAVEKYPLPIQAIRDGLAGWADEIGAELDELAAHYPAQPTGVHQMRLGNVRLSLYCGDVEDVLPRIGDRFDTLYLDGFAPAKNPAMWSPNVCTQLARLSRKGTTLATFTVAGVVRRNLTDAGFAVQKTPGYGRKFQMLTGTYAGAAAARDDGIAS